MKGFINNFYTYDFTGSFTMTTVQMKMISKSIWNLLKKEDDRDEVEASASVIDAKAASKLYCYRRRLKNFITR